MSSSAVSSSAVLSSDRFTGRVKWFNNKAGYGFVTITDGPKSGGDVFVHHTCINVEAEQYKYLVQGEYVEFSLSEAKNSNNDVQAAEVSGIKGGKLMCETRLDSRSSRTQFRSIKNETETSSEPVKMPRSVAAPKVRGEGSWTYVAKSKNSDDFENSQSSSVDNRTSSGRGFSRGTGRGSGRGRGRPRTSDKA